MNENENERAFEQMPPEEQFADLLTGYANFKAILPRNHNREWGWLFTKVYESGLYRAYYHYKWRLETKIPPFTWIRRYRNKKWNTIRSRFIEHDHPQEYQFILYFSIFEVLGRFIDTIYPTLDADELKKSEYCEPFRELQEIWDWWRMKGMFVLRDGTLDVRDLYNEAHSGIIRQKNPLFTENAFHSLDFAFSSNKSYDLLTEKEEEDRRIFKETMKEMYVYMKRIIDLSPYMEDD